MTEPAGNKRFVTKASAPPRKIGDRYRSNLWKEQWSVATSAIFLWWRMILPSTGLSLLFLVPYAVAGYFYHRQRMTIAGDFKWVPIITGELLIIGLFTFVLAAIFAPATFRMMNQKKPARTVGPNVDSAALRRAATMSFILFAVSVILMMPGSIVFGVYGGVAWFVGFAIALVGYVIWWFVISPFAVAVPVAVVEKKSIIDSLAKSRQLLREAYKTSDKLSVFVIAVFTICKLPDAIMILARWAFQDPVPPPRNDSYLFFIRVGSLVILLPILAIGVNVIYYRVRVKADDLDADEEITRVF